MMSAIDFRLTMKVAAILVVGAAVFMDTPARAEPRVVEPRSVAVLDYELVDDHENPATKEAQQRRLQAATRQLKEGLAARGLFVVKQGVEIDQLQKTLHDQQQFLYRCDDCASQIGEAAHTDLVMSTWVQKVSELILNMNLQIYDMKKKQLVFTKSVDMRGNTDKSWQRAMKFMLDDIEEKRKANPKYAAGSED